MLPYDTLETEHICASDSELEVWVSAYTSVSVEFHVGAPLSALGGGGGQHLRRGTHSWALCMRLLPWV